VRRARLWLILMLGAVALALFPWTAYLSASLPARHVSHHWDVVWAGFDLFEALALAATVIALVRCSPIVSLLAAVSGTALLCDAWFDLLTAGSGRNLGWALLEALAGELPLAVLCFWVSYEATAATSADERALAAALRPTAQPAPPVAGRERART
jgi:hypothetical protein